MRIRKKKELERVRAELDRRTEGYHGEDIWDLRDFLMLLNIADYDKMGKSKAIIYAYKMGFAEGKKDSLKRIVEYLKKGGADNE